MMVTGHRKTHVKRYFLFTASIWAAMGLVVLFLEVTGQDKAVRWVSLTGAWLVVLAVLWAGWWRLGRLTEQLETAQDELSMMNDRLEEKVVEDATEISTVTEELTQTGVKLAVSTEELKKESGERARIEKRSEELQRRLDDKNMEMENFMLLIAHELRSPLINIQGFCIRLGKLNKKLADMLGQPEVPLPTRELGKRLTGEDIPKALNYIESGANRMNTLIMGLHNLAVTWSQPVLYQHLDVNQLVSGLVSSMKYQLQHAGTDVETGDLPPCQGDREQLSIVFSNLLENAIKYRDQQRRLVIGITGTVKDGKVVYAVTDTGAGISEERQKGIWDFGGIAGDGEAATGAGHGLAIVKRLVERMDGRIWFESVLGKGTRFFIEMPEAADEGDRQGEGYSPAGG